MFVVARRLSVAVKQKVAASGGYSSLPYGECLIAVFSLVAEHGLQGRGLQ